MGDKIWYKDSKGEFYLSNLPENHLFLDAQSPEGESFIYVHVLETRSDSAIVGSKLLRIDLPLSSADFSKADHAWINLPPLKGTIGSMVSVSEDGERIIFLVSIHQNNYTRIAYRFHIESGQLEEIKP